MVESYKIIHLKDFSFSLGYQLKCAAVPLSEARCRESLFHNALPPSLNWVIPTAFDALGLFFLSVYMKPEQQHNLILQDLFFNHRDGSSGGQRVDPIFSSWNWFRSNNSWNHNEIFFSLSAWTSSFIFQQLGTSLLPMNHGRFAETKCGQSIHNPLNSLSKILHDGGNWCQGTIVLGVWSPFTRENETIAWD